MYSGRADQKQHLPVYGYTLSVCDKHPPRSLSEKKSINQKIKASNKKNKKKSALIQGNVEKNALAFGFHASMMAFISIGEND